ncbi:MAG: CxxC-x17-CxxC domain-containing protein [Patescibacteria group bacterium]
MQNDQNSFGQRKMYQGNWSCSKCGAAITELPFEPDGTRPLFCQDCYRQNRNDRPRRQF